MYQSDVHPSSQLLERKDGSGRHALIHQNMQSKTVEMWFDYYSIQNNMSLDIQHAQIG